MRVCIHPVTTRGNHTYSGTEILCELLFFLIHSVAHSVALDILHPSHNLRVVNPIATPHLTRVRRLDRRQHR